MAPRVSALKPFENVHDMLASLDELRNLYQDQDRQIKEARLDMEQSNPIAIPDKLRVVDVEVHDPSLQYEVQHRAAAFTINDWKLHITPNNGSDKAISNATKREQFFEALFEEIGDRLPQHTRDALVGHVLADGGAYLKLLFNKDVWELRYSLRLKDFEDDPEPIRDEPDTTTRGRRPRHRTAEEKFNEATENAKRGAGPPFEWMCIDPLMVYPRFVGGKLVEVFEVQERPMFETFRRYQLRRDSDGNIRKSKDLLPEEVGEAEAQTRSAVGSVIFIEHWNDTYATYAVVGKNSNGDVTGEIVQQWRHRYGRQPYTFVPGLWMSHWRNRKVGWGIVETKRFLKRYREFLWTLLAQIAARDALTPIAHELPDTGTPVLGEDGKPLLKEDIDFSGVIYHLYGGEKMAPVQFPPVAESVKIQLEIVEKSIADMSMPKLPQQLSGLEGAGFAMSTVLAEAKARDHPVMINIERGMRDQTEFAEDLIRSRIGETVYVYRERGKEAGWISLGPDDLQERLRMRWTIDPERPSAKIVEARYWHERLQQGTAHEDQVAEALGDNPDELRRGKARDRIRKSPWYQKFLDEQVAQIAGRGDLLREAYLAAEIAATGQLPGGGGPGVPGTGGMPGTPDFANLAMAPGGVGAAPVGGAPTIPPNQGTSPGPVTPAAAGGAGIQRLQG